ncbi:hypothetical protein [Sphaerisporangium dianthi]|uniref:Uncharacterized protein n=1 Tax=Sphaerisporangium dianthi TaxID=1436120 RepID=A0ABV9CQV7_9ACTN
MPEDRLPAPALFDGHARGAYTLPDELLKLRDVHTKLTNEPWPVPPQSSWELTGQLATATVDALYAGAPLPDPADIERARAAERVRADTIELLGMALEIAARRVSSCIREQSEQIITGHLAPALDATWQGIREAVGVLHQHGEDEPRRLLSAPAKVRKASDQLDQLAETYTVIRAGRQAMWSMGIRCIEDPGDRYATLANFDDLHRTRMAMSRTPWHGMSLRQTLIYFVDHAAQPWMPTPEQQAAKVAEAIANGPHKLKAVGF